MYDKDTVCVLGAASREILYDIHTVCVGGNSTLYIHARTSTASKLIDAYSGTSISGLIYLCVCV
jgi:hypothetical protein